jgi:SsrA-binding protein
MANKAKASGTIQNRRAKFDYDVEDELTAGIVLTGAETKALRLGHGNLRGSYVTVKDDELWLINATITGSTAFHIDEESQTRARKLLIKKKQLAKILAAKQQGRTIIPLKILNKQRYIKVVIATGKGKKTYDKREKIKKRTQDREAMRSISHRNSN